MQQLHKFSNKSVQQIVQELMYDEYLERDNMLRNAFNSSPLKAVKKNSIFKEHLQQLFTAITEFGNFVEQSMQGHRSGSDIKEKESGCYHQCVSIQYFNCSPKNVKKVNKPKELRGLSISDHMDNVIRDKNNLPQIQRQSQKSLVFNDDDFEGYKLKSEEMTLEIDEYMKMKKDKDSFHCPIFTQDINDYFYYNLFMM